ncbi:MaoC/PaaZ C-terminal domain-containing protein [Neobacillus sp. NRS-1170]|uniref:MaoC/PaaZ C-terminal domain-containing protein n=1 Tax=Neobacillus sp. NRS-1170 TaxID=3233898 RepID=UPI003D2E8480
MNVGNQFMPLHKEEITHTQLVRYAGASGDFNPIHTVVPFAEKAGLGGVIAHGMMIMGFIGQAIGTWFSPDQLNTFSARFRSMTKPGEKITVKGSVINETANTWVCEAFAVNENDEVKVSAVFEISK